MLGVNKSNCDIVVIILQIYLGKKSNLMTNKEQANNLKGTNIECIGKNISNSINPAIKASFNLIPLAAP